MKTADEEFASRIRNSNRRAAPCYLRCRRAVQRPLRRWHAHIGISYRAGSPRASLQRHLLHGQRAPQSS